MASASKGLLGGLLGAAVHQAPTCGRAPRLLLLLTLLANKCGASHIQHVNYGSGNYGSGPMGSGEFASGSGDLSGNFGSGDFGSGSGVGSVGPGSGVGSGDFGSGIPFPPAPPPPSPPPAAPPPPSTPPTSPPPAQPPATHQVEVTLVAAGTVSDYGATEVSNLRSAFASAAGVDVGAVSVSITAASVLITATIGVASASAVTSVTSNLATALPDASTASSLLGITVTSAPTVATVQLGGCAAGELGIQPPWGDFCVPCPAGYVCGFNTTIFEALVPCAAGSYCPEGNASAPIACPTGYDCTGTKNTRLQPCAPGTHSGASDLGCVVCGAGTECHYPATTSPLPCPSGKFSDAISSESGMRCQPCAAGTYRAMPGGTSADSCIACGEGLTSAEGSTEAAACYNDPASQLHCTAAGGAIGMLAIGALVGAGGVAAALALMPRLNKNGAGNGPKRIRPAAPQRV